MTGNLAVIDEQIGTGKLEEARQALEKIQPNDENRADLLFLQGRLHEAAYEREKAFEAFQQAARTSPEHAAARFRAATLAYQVGDDETALHLYEECVSIQPTHANALLNLAVLYEEKGLLHEAESCLHSVLSEHPEHHRARQFLKSVDSSYSMVYDDQKRRDQEQRSALLDQPLTDFELSVRSRNCLRQMNLRTLGDLLKVSEQELLSYKNFGETSLNEIKNLLSQKGLSLGQALAPQMRQVAPPQAPFTGENAGVLNKPVSELELSVRSRKCLQMLGVSTLGELVAHSENELMAMKNFGQTSLNEIKGQLAHFGLTFRSPR